MRLAAMYFNHPFFEEKQTVNFGGKYLYSFKEEGDEIIITAEENKQFIEDFFIPKDIKNKEDISRLELVSAIVGENGSGKSVLLNYIIQGFNEIQNPTYKRIKPNILFVYEHKNNVILSQVNNSEFSRKTIRLSPVKNNNLGREENINPVSSTYLIYYSPYFDLNPIDNENVYDIFIKNIILKDIGNYNDYRMAMNMRHLNFVLDKILKKDKNIFQKLDEFKRYNLFSNLKLILSYNPNINWQNLHEPYVDLLNSKKIDNNLLQLINLIKKIFYKIEFSPEQSPLYKCKNRPPVSDKWKLYLIASFFYQLLSYFTEPNVDGIKFSIHNIEKYEDDLEKLPKENTCKELIKKLKEILITFGSEIKCKKKKIIDKTKFEQLINSLEDLIKQINELPPHYRKVNDQDIEIPPHLNEKVREIMNLQYELFKKISQNIAHCTNRPARFSGTDFLYFL